MGLVAELGRETSGEHLAASDSDVLLHGNTHGRLVVEHLTELCQPAIFRLLITAASCSATFPCTDECPSVALDLLVLLQQVLAPPLQPLHLILHILPLLSQVIPFEAPLRSLLLEIEQHSRSTGL